MSLFHLGLDIGRIYLSVCSDKKGFIGELESRYRKFLNPDNTDGSFKIMVSHAHSAGPASDIRLLRIGDSYFIDSDDFDAKIDMNRNEALVNMQANHHIFDSFLRVLYSAILLPKDGFLIHSLGLEKDDKGYLFPGPSSSGKSTIARTIRGFRVLSDELVGVRKMGGVFYLFATPFIGEFNAHPDDIAVVLKKIFFLCRGLPNPCQTQTGAEALISLLSNVFFFARDLESNRRILKLCSELASGVCAYRIDVLGSKDIGRLIDDIQ